MQYVDREAFPSSSPQSRLTPCLALAFCLSLAVGNQPVQAQPKPKPVANKNAKAPPKPLEKFEPPDPELLPPGWQAPLEPPAIMDLEQPIATKEELANLKKFVPKFSKALRDCDLSPNGKLIVESSIRYKLAEMTLRDKRKDLPELHKVLMREITTNIYSNPGMKPADVANMVQFVNSEIAKQIPELLVNNFYVRLHAVLILSELDYAPAYTLLLKVIQAKDTKDDPLLGQPPAVKVAAIQGLIRILKFTSPPVVQRTAIAHAIIGELQKTDTHWWYQLRLVEGLRHITVAIDAGNNKPFVIDALLAVITDRSRAWVVRCKACYAIGRVPIPAAVKPDDVVTVVADCAFQLANAAQAKPNDPIWKGCFWDVYLAFKADGSKDKDGKDKDLDAEGRTVGGLLARFKQQAQPAYDRIVPIARDVIHGNAPNAGDVKNLGDFVSPRLPQKPADPKVDGGRNTSSGLPPSNTAKTQSPANPGSPISVKAPN